MTRPICPRCQSTHVSVTRGIPQRLECLTCGYSALKSDWDKEHEHTKHQGLREVREALASVADDSTLRLLAQTTDEDLTQILANVVDVVGDMGRLVLDALQGVE